MLVAVLALTAGCAANAEPSEFAPERNATLGLSSYEQVSVTSPSTTRQIVDRSESWEDPGKRPVTVVSRATTYRNATGEVAVVVYTTPAKTYAPPDRLRPLSAGELAALATRSTDTGVTGNASGDRFGATLLDREVTVHRLDGPDGQPAAHVAHRIGEDVVVVVVVTGGADEAAVRSVVESVRLPAG